MGKSAKLFKSLVSGVKAFKSPSKEKSVKEPASTAHTREDKRHGGKDKCMWSLGKSSSRSRDAYAVAAAASSPETIEIKCVEVDSEKLKDVLPIPTAEACVESSGPVKAHATSVNPCHGTTIGMLQQTCPAESAMASEQKERAAAKIQATFRCYLAQRAFRALRALVRLQALARGRIVRKQALSSLRCMQALIRVQALSRGRRVRNSELGQVVQKHLQQARQSRMKKPAEGWVNTMSTSQQLHQRAQSKQDAAMKRQRALVAVLSEQLNKDTLKRSPSIECDEELNKSHWAWSWLERWTVASTSVISRTSMAERHTVADKSMAKEKVIVEPGNKHKESFKKEVKKASDILNSPVKAQEKTPVAVKREEKVKMPTETEKVVKREEKVKTVTDTEKVVKREERVKTSTETDKVGLKKANLFGSSSAVPAKSMSPAVPSAPLSSLKDEASALKDEVCASKETSLQAEKPSISSMVVAGSEGSDETLPTLGTESMATNASSAPDTRSPTVREIEEAYPNATDSQSKSPILSTADTCDDGTRLSLPNRSMYPYLSSESLLPSDPPACLEELTTPNDLPHGTSVPEMLEMPETILSPKGGEATQSVSEAVEVTNEDMDVKDEEEAIHIGTSPDINGGCDASVTSFDEKSVKSSIKVSVLAGSKHDAHVEGDSPAFLPSYMATTKSSKAKVRTPKQKSSDSPKQKADSPKPKLDSPKLKTESPKPRLDPITPKLDSVTKRRHSLSALDGKTSPATQTPKQTMQTMHVRVNSRGYLKDMSIDGSPLSNGGGSGRQRK